MVNLVDKKCRGARDKKEVRIVIRETRMVAHFTNSRAHEKYVPSNGYLLVFVTCWNCCSFCN